jgi:hypothetical protein
MYKTFGILGLFLFIVIILIVDPRVIHTAYNNTLGRIILIGIIIYLSMNSVTLGLLVVLCLIIATNMFFIQESFVEGIGETIDTSTSGTTIGDTNASDTSDSNTTKQIQIITNALKKAQESKDPMNEKTISELLAQSQAQGVDRQSIEDSIRSISSKTLPISNPGSSEGVVAIDSAKKGFGSQY